MISKEEKQKRKEAVEYAKASVGLEGVFLSKGLLSIADEYVNGKYSEKEFVEKYLKAVDDGV